MAKFVNSGDSISSSLLLWNDVPTQTSIEETYQLKVWPATNLLNDGPIQFIIPPQPKGLLSDIHIISKLKIQKNGVDISGPQRDISIINNLANSLWGEVSVVLADRTELCQSMRNAYAYQTFFNHALNSESEHQDYLFYNEAFLMDSGLSKKSEEDLRIFWKWDESKNYILEDPDVPDGSTIEETQAIMKENQWDIKFSLEDRHLIATAFSGDTEDETKIKRDNAMYYSNAWIPTKANSAASIRSTRVNSGQSLTLASKFQCPLFNTSKSLPSNMKIRISVTKNRDEFLLLCNDDAGYNVVLEDCHLDVTYYRVRDEILNIMEERLAKDAAMYFISRPEIIVRPIVLTSKKIRMNHIFNDKLPSYAFFALQRSEDFEGKFSSNCYTFIPFTRFQFYVNGVPYFNDSLEATMTRIKEGNYACKDFGDYMRQLYKTIGKEAKGNCLIDSTNFHLNFMAAVSFGADRSSLSERHLNLQERGSTYIEMDMGVEDVPDDLVLIVYALFDRQVQIDQNRMVRIVE